eukprot:11086431-Ditylum_brightwellii.AAC.1
MEKLKITPLNSPYDESAGFGNNDANCTTEGELEAVMLRSVRMAGDWKFDEDTVLMIALQGKVSDDVMGARLQGGYGDYMRMVVEEHRQYGQRMLGKDELCTLIPVLNDYFIAKQHQRQQESTSSTYYYELYDGNMLYMLTQHCCGTENIILFCYVPVIKEMASMSVSTSVSFFLQQNRNRSTQGQSAGGHTKARKTKHTTTNNIQNGV